MFLVSNLLVYFLICAALLDHEDVVGGLERLDRIEVLGNAKPVVSLLHPGGATGLNKLRHDKKKQLARGKYTTKEEIQKPPSEDHPCRLTKTTVRISFPGMKSEVFVNLLGYKEPNIMHLQRCKGHCGGMGSHITCAATNLRQKTVKMTVKTKLIGREPRQKFKNLVLEEHTACGCQCRHISRNSCMEPGRFNNLTCECECDEAEFGRLKMMCDRRRNTYWDATSCSCKSKSVSPRGVELPGEGCMGPPQLSDVGLDYPLDDLNPFLTRNRHGISAFTWLAAGVLGCVSVLMAATTFYYRTKFKQIHKKYYRKKSKRAKNKEDKEQRSRESTLETNKPKKVKKSSSFVLSKSANDLELVLCDVPGGGDLYHEQYDEHGVKIEPQQDETELIQKYFQSIDVGGPLNSH